MKHADDMKTIDLFDIKHSRAARDMGMDSVTEHNDTWFDRAMLEIARMRNAWPAGGDFIGEDIRAVVTNAVGSPSHPNAWGALIRCAVKEGLIRKNGKYRQMRAVSSHARITAVYVWSR